MNNIIELTKPIAPYKLAQRVKSTKIKIIESGYRLDKYRDVGVTVTNPEKPLSRRDKHRLHLANKVKGT